jgi:hypothetical protein
MFVASQLLAVAEKAVLGSEAALVNTAAVAGLASALTSWAKRTVQFIQAAVQTAQEQASAATPQDLFPSYFPAVLPEVALMLLQPFEAALERIMQQDAEAAGSSLDDASRNSSNSSNRDSIQKKASMSLLVVVLVRSLVQLADAMEAVGPQLLFNALCKRPWFGDAWQQQQGPQRVSARLISRYPLAGKIMRPAGRPQQHTAEGQWQYWQLLLLESCQHWQNCLLVLEIEPEDEGMTDAAEAQVDASLGNISSAAGAAGEAAAETDPIARSADAVQKVTWGYLLCLLQTSSRWDEAMAAFCAKWPLFCVRHLPMWSRVTDAVAADMKQQLQDCLTLFTALIAAAPLPVTCSNPGCANLAGVSEASESSKKCKECKCRYCSAAARQLTGSSTSMPVAACVLQATYACEPYSQASWPLLNRNVLVLSVHAPPASGCTVQGALSYGRCALQSLHATCCVYYILAVHPVSCNVCCGFA